MAITKRVARNGKARYTARVNLPGEEGARKWRNVGTYETRKKAEDAERKALADRDRGTLLEPTKMTVAELLDEWLKRKSKQITSNTAADYESSIRVHILPAIGSVKIQKLTKDRIQGQYDKWEAAGLSPRVIRGCELRLSAALDFAVAELLIPNNPAKFAKPPRVVKAGFDHWNAQEASAFLRAVDTYHAEWREREPDRYLLPAVLWRLLLAEGLRRGEALGLRWQDVNWNQGTISIVQSVVADRQAHGAAMIQPRTKTRAGARTVSVSARTLEALKDRHKAWRLQKLAAVEWQETDLVVSTENGGPVNPTFIHRPFLAIVKEAGLRRIKIHELRHSCASLLFEVGIPAKIVQEKLGHSSVAITLDTYSHVAPGMHAEAATAMDRILSSNS